VSKAPKPVQVADAAAATRARRAQGLGRVWWRRAFRVLWAPRSVFLALRETDEGGEAARQEPILAIVILAGMAAILMQGGTILDDPSVDLLVAAVVTYVAGGVYGAAGYFVLGLGVMIGVRGAGGETTFRRGRHLVAFSAVPVATSFFLLAPVVTLAYGSSYFRGHAPDSSRWVVLCLGLPFVAWSAALLAGGLRVTYRLAWAGVAAATSLAAVFVAAFVLLPVVL
jgi:hypothetical protein